MWPHSLLSEILLDLITFQDARGRGVASDWPLVHPQSSVSLKVETRIMNMAELVFVGNGGPRIFYWYFFRKQNEILCNFSKNTAKFYVIYMFLCNLM